MAGVALLAILVAGMAVYFLYLEPRPLDTTAQWVFAEHAYAVDYCPLAELDGSELTADQIPKAFTPSCETERWPADGVNDINQRRCNRARAAIRWDDGEVLAFRPWGWATLVTRRLEDDNTLIWEYTGQPTSRFKRICRLPTDA